MEHDLIRKPVSILGSSPRTGIFGIMLRVPKIHKQFRINEYEAVSLYGRPVLPGRKASARLRQRF
jgi:hypothetical protein